MMYRVMTTGLVALTMGCAAAPAAEGGGGFPAPGEENAMCDGSRADSLIGRPATSELGAEALRLTGARGLRWIQPGQAVTMDYRPDRLNIELDAQNRVVTIRCG